MSKFPITQALFGKDRKEWTQARVWGMVRYIAMRDKERDLWTLYWRVNWLKGDDVSGDILLRDATIEKIYSFLRVKPQASKEKFDAPL